MKKTVVSHFRSLFNKPDTHIHVDGGLIMQITSVGRQPAVLSPLKKSVPASVRFGYEYKGPPDDDGKKPNSLDNLKRKLTPGPQAKYELKQIGVGGGLATAGLTLAPYIPIPAVSTVVGMIALWGGIWIAIPGVVSFFRRKF